MFMNKSAIRELMALNIFVFNRLHSKNKKRVHLYDQEIIQSQTNSRHREEETQNTS